ncbi:MAG TPA: GGDEF domain-containing protein [Pseudonocardiaceae bacterium]|nr:GGDEF domain-containing protein [Pseudonocardiaceae bacterium]
MSALLDGVHFAYQPLFNVTTGGVIAVEALARPPAGNVRDLLRDAADTGQLTPTDFGLAALAVRHAARWDLKLPLHVNLLAATVARAHVGARPLVEAVRDVGRRPADVVIELNPPFSAAPAQAFAQGVQALHNAGFRLALDGVGDGDTPLTLLTAPFIELIKLDRSVTVGVPEEQRHRATVEALMHVCEQSSGQLVAEGVETAEQLAALRALGVRLAQGHALGAPTERPATHLSIPTAADDTLATEPLPLEERRVTGPRVTDLMKPASTLPANATAEDVRTMLADDQSVNCVVLLDESERPQHTVDRNRFLLAVTGPYGHALHAKRAANRLADKPRVVPIGASVFDLLDVLGGGETSRTNDDLVVVDAAHRCLGVVRVADLIRAVADTKVEQAAALNPLTRLPGSDSVARDVDRRVRAGEIFAVGWLDIDSFKMVNDEFGFASGDELIRQVGQALTSAGELRSVRVGHVGGDDFLLVTSLDELMAVGGRLIDRQWTVEDVPITVSLATLVCAAGSVSGYREVSRLLAPLKHRAKSLPGSSWVVGRPGTEEVHVLRQARSPHVPAPTRGHHLTNDHATAPAPRHLAVH